jgi:hypothetical protein
MKKGKSFIECVMFNRLMPEGGVGALSNVGKSGEDMPCRYTESHSPSKAMIRRYV